VGCLFFVTLIKWKKAPLQEVKPQMDEYTKTMNELEKQGIKMQSYWTLGRYHGVTIIEAPSEKDVAKIHLSC
jgi:uncharacterized protein with GYD domain